MPTEVTQAAQEVQCRFCGDRLILAEDSLQARQNGTDPHQQLRKHLATHLKSTAAAVYSFGWMIDMLCFAPVGDPERWRKNLHDLLDYYVSRPNL